MNIILSGYGKMGKEIEKEALRKGHQILAIFDQKEDWENLSALASENPVIIDFSEPGEVTGNIKRCFIHHLPMVVGTTGWDDQKEEIRKQCNTGDQTLFVASNFSIGMNLFFTLNKYFAGLINEFEDYDPSLEEIHHLQKKDKPSGTAIVLANLLIEKMKRKKGWALHPEEKEDFLSVKAIREADVPGTHKILFDSEFDSIELVHRAKNRRGFASGAVRAAEWLQGRKGFFGMEDLMNL